VQQQINKASNAHDQVELGYRRGRSGVGKNSYLISMINSCDTYEVFKSWNKQLNLK
jgi:hypothetical protein